MYALERSREERPEVLVAAMRAIRVATFVTQDGDGRYHSSMAPVVVAGPPGAPVLEAHLARANPHWRALGEGRPTLALFQGPQAYVTPSWYATKAETGKVVPTWAYVAVSAEGIMEPVADAAWLAAQVAAVTDLNEAGRAEPWAVTDAPEDYVAGMLRGIVGVRLTVARMSGSWKLNQHRTEGDRAGVTAGLAAEGGEGAALAALMARVGAEPGAG